MDIHLPIDGNTLAGAGFGVLGMLLGLIGPSLPLIPIALVMTAAGKASPPPEAGLS